MRRSAQEIFNDLVKALEQVTEMSAKDPNPFWYRHLATHLEDANRLRKRGNVSEEEVRDLCGTIRSMYAGRDESFGLYAPMVDDPASKVWKVIPGTEGFESLRNRLYKLADEIRIVGSY